MKDYAELYKETQEMLREHCYDNEVTVTGIARELGTTRQPLNYLMQGKVVRPSTLYKVHKYLVGKGVTTVSS